MRLAIFASGTGSNFEAIARAIDNKTLDATIALVVSDKPKAPVVAKAQSRNLETFTFVPKEYQSKADYESEILARLVECDVTHLVLVGYMRLLGPTLLNAYPCRIINIHPSLLPKYKGKDALGQALRNNDLVLGVTVHYVDETLDGGPIIKQRSFTRMSHDQRPEVEAVLHRIEHELIVEVLEEMK